MSDKKRYIFAKDIEQCKLGFASAELATAEADKLGPRDTDERRVRVRMRQRTSLWDVVVKVRRAVEETKEQRQPEPAK